MNNLHLGNYGEKTVLNALLYAGFKLVRLNGKRSGDITVVSPNGEVVNIEVKTARKNKSRCWQYCLNKSGHTSTRHADYVVFLQLCDAGLAFYVVPANILTNKQIKLYSITDNKLNNYACSTIITGVNRYVA